MTVRMGLGVVALLISGCLSSENGLVPPGGGDRAVFDPALLGDWEPDPPREEKELKPGEPRFFRVERAAPGARLYRFVDPDGRNFDQSQPTRPEFYLVAVGKSRYLDVTLIEEVDGGQKRRIARHFFARAAVERGTLTLQHLNHEYFLKHREEVAVRVEHGTGILAMAEFPVITASPAQVVAFLERHEADPGLWEGMGPLRFRRR